MSTLVLKPGTVLMCCTASLYRVQVECNLRLTILVFFR